MPQFYQLKDSNTYLVFAKKSAKAGIYRQLWRQHKGKDDQGVLLCNDHTTR